MACLACVCLASAALAQDEPQGPIDLYGDQLPTVSQPQERVWLDAEYLLWWERNMPVPGVMLTTTSDPARAGILGRPGTSIILDDDGFDSKNHSGFRATIGVWINPDVFGVEAGGFVLETHTVHFWRDTDRLGNPLLARPFFNTLTGMEDAQVISLPSTYGPFVGARGGVDGSVFGGIDFFSDTRVWGGQGNLVFGLRQFPGRLELLAGFRYLGLEDQLRSSQSSTIDMANSSFMPRPLALNGGFVPGPDIVSITDRARTRNEFFGGQMGLRGSWSWGPWKLDASSVFGLGDTRQWVNITGITEWTGPTGTFASVPAGLYAVGDNRGYYSRHHFTWMTEENVKIGYNLTQRATVNVGFAVLSWSGVLRAGDQLQRAIDPRTVPSNLAYDPTVRGTAPQQAFVTSDFWALGLTAGFEIRY